MTDIKYPHLSLRTAKLTEPCPHQRPLSKGQLHVLPKFAHWGSEQNLKQNKTTEHPLLSPAPAMGPAHVA